MDGGVPSGGIRRVVVRERRRRLRTHFGGYRDRRGGGYAELREDQADDRTGERGLLQDRQADADLRIRVCGPRRHRPSGLHRGARRSGRGSFRADVGRPDGPGGVLLRRGGTRRLRPAITAPTFARFTTAYASSLVEARFETNPDETFTFTGKITPNAYTVSYRYIFDSDHNEATEAELRALLEAGGSGVKTDKGVKELELVKSDKAGVTLAVLSYDDANRPANSPARSFRPRTWRR